MIHIKITSILIVVCYIGLMVFMAITHTHVWKIFVVGTIAVIIHVIGFIDGIDSCNKTKPL